uniref:Reverse transcriptase zinc-binding domain-containing protein n=1 Tax=Bracon brevicornis TaxID=1563983 RepID=A0A6V7KNY5_9HYME
MAAEIGCIWEREINESPHPQLDDGVNRKHEGLNYYLTEMFSNHECLRAHHHRFKYEETPDCPAECGAPEDAEHTFFHCLGHEAGSGELEATLKTGPKLETLVPPMIQREKNWDSVHRFVRVIITKPRQEEREGRENERGLNERSSLITESVRIRRQMMGEPMG